MIETLIGVVNMLLGIEHPYVAAATGILLAIFTVVGAAAVFVEALEQVAKLTPTDKDDIALGKAKRFLAAVIAVFDRLALNPPKSRARDD